MFSVYNTSVGGVSKRVCSSHHTTRMATLQDAENVEESTTQEEEKDQGGEEIKGEISGRKQRKF